MKIYSEIEPQIVARYLENNKWDTYVRKQYFVQIQKADLQQIYNVSDSPGIVYNFLEDSYEKVIEDGYVITGLLGEMWPIPKEGLTHYDVGDLEIGIEPVLVSTQKSNLRYEGIQIPEKFLFTLNISGIGVLKGNHKGNQHAGGDYVVKEIRGTVKQAIRIVNGMIFDKMYQKL